MSTGLEFKLRNEVQRGTRANQPTAANSPAGTLYFVTDEIKLERSTGAAWQSYSNTAITPSYAQIYNSAAQNLTNGAWNVLTFDSEDIDTDSYHNPLDPTKFTAPATGFYLVWGQCANIAPSGVGSRGVWVNRNGDVTLTIPGMFVFYPPVAAIYGTFPEILLGMPMTAGDYIQINAFQDSGGTLSSGGGGGIRSQQNMFGIMRIA